MNTTTEPTTALLLTADEAARSLRISARTLWSLTKAGSIPSIRIGPSGRAVRYCPNDLADWIARQKQKNTT